jgi:peroxiredoxin
MADITDHSIGSQAPDFNLHSSSDTDITLSSFSSKSNVYLFFVREFN